jgi:hypothetical protein
MPSPIRSSNDMVLGVGSGFGGGWRTRWASQPTRVSLVGSETLGRSPSAGPDASGARLPFQISRPMERPVSLVSKYKRVLPRTSAVIASLLNVPSFSEI